MHKPGVAETAKKVLIKSINKDEFIKSPFKMSEIQTTK